MFTIAISAFELANVVIVKLLQDRYFTLGIFALLHANALHLLDGELFAIFFSAVDDAKRATTEFLFDVVGVLDGGDGDGVIGELGD